MCIKNLGLIVLISSTIYKCLFLGYFKNTTDHTEIPAGSSTARTDVTIVTVFWYLIRQRPAEQI